MNLPGCANAVRLAIIGIMSTRHRKARGRATERIVTSYLAKELELSLRNPSAGESGSDVLGLPGLDIEIKARADFKPQEAFKQQDKRKEANKGLVVLRMNGMGEDAGEYYAMMRLKDLVPLIKQSKPAEEIERCNGCGSWIVHLRACVICEKITKSN